MNSFHKKLSTAMFVAACGVAGQTARATLIYQNTFDSLSGSGVSISSAASTTPGGGAIGISSSTNGHVTLSTTGGIQGGSLDATNGQTYGTADPAGVGGTAVGAGTALTGLPNQSAGAGQMNSFTITFWMKGTAAGMNAANFPRLFVLGASGSTDLTANTFGLELRGGAVDVEANGVVNAGNSGKGAVLAANTWNFIAVTYDGTSTGGFNSSVQVAATGDSHNVQLYEGTDTSSVTRYGVADTSDGNTSTGTLQFGANSVLLLANRTNLGRGFNGFLDDFRIYDTVMTQAQVDAVRTSVAPEPSTAGMIFVAGLMAMRRRRRRVG